MSKQQAAPGALEQVRAFVNSADFGEEAEEFAGPDALGKWLAEHGLADRHLEVADSDLRRAIELREALRAILLSHTDGRPVPASAVATLDDAACRAGVRLRFSEDGDAVLEPEADGVEGALGRLLAIMHAALADGTWQRLKACREHSCEWAFYDHTKNRSGTWCKMEVCGNRAKARAYRERRATAHE